ncbi:hypothetical protein [Chryseobacterium luteum]|uniref:Uncharacterized protein n=1 Tax=Chryseobacterium luteum TaxID=421531 RepID=A0A085ZX60_9FLAO|nr:hypothetical protein [Chryseobacterium luteum]KFF09024.1 hypothetical protein IX38_00460 [Chryseobacterium luteum]
MKTGNIGIRNLADIGVADIDVYGTGRRGTSSTTPKLIMFFRSEDQAKGLPKLDSSGNVKGDSKYDQSFGFDLFNERLYGNNTDVYKNGYYEKQPKKRADGTIIYEADGTTPQLEDKTDAAGNKIEKKIGKLETFYDKESSLLTELKDSGTSFFIDNEYTLSKRNKKMTDLSYYIPNILIKPGKEVKLYAKFFDTDSASRLGMDIFLKPSSNKGIEFLTDKLTFNKSEEVLEFKIKTKLSEPIEFKTIITAHVKDSTGKEVEIGKLALLPNKLLQAKLFFIDVFYNTTTASTPFNGTTMITNLNQKAMNQASVELISGGVNKSFIIKPTDEALKNGVYDGQPISGVLTNKGTGKPYELSDLGKGLRIITSKFYESMVNEILANIEIELKKLDVNDGAVTRKLIDVSSSIKDELNSLDAIKDFKLDDGTIIKRYNFIIQTLYNYLHHEFNINYIFAFICHNIETTVTSSTSGTTTTTSRDEAMAFLDAKELIIPNNAIGKTMTLAHEIAHNFGVRHTFDIPGTEPQIGDIKLAQKQTLENIMDYPKNGDADRRNFIRYQWEKMREKTDSNVNTISELNFVKQEYYQYVGLVDYTKEKGFLWDFSQNLIYFLMKALANKYSGDLGEIKNSSDKILTIFTNEITKTLNKI